MTKVSANQVSAADDALVQKLQKEIQHLKDILNLKRKGGAHDLHQQLLILKEENSKLKDMVAHNHEVEALKQENRAMRQELHMMKTSPRLMIEGGEGVEGTQSPTKTISDAAFSMDVPPYRRSLDPRDTEPKPTNKG